MQIEVRYYLDEPAVEFDCPFCSTTKRHPGGHQVNGKFHPTPTQVVDSHLFGAEACLLVSAGRALCQVNYEATGAIASRADS
jgi:hypothetical protein